MQLNLQPPINQTRCHPSKTRYITHIYTHTLTKTNKPLQEAKTTNKKRFCKTPPSPTWKTTPQHNNRITRSLLSVPGIRNTYSQRSGVTLNLSHLTPPNTKSDQELRPQSREIERYCCCCCKQGEMSESLMEIGNKRRLLLDPGGGGFKEKLIDSILLMEARCGLGC